jgi:lambda repressor-like predicted transcriptional regulator
MRYDFRKVQKAIHERGLTLQAVALMTKVNASTVKRALDNNSARQSTAKAFSDAFGIPMRSLLRKDAA